MGIPRYLSKLIDDGNAILANNIIKSERNTLASTGSCSLDWALGGGIPRNEMTLVWGTPGSGKTTLALKMMAKELELNPEKVAIWIDTEYAWDTERARSFNVDTERVVLLQGNTFEKVISPLGKIADDIIETKGVCFVGLDSIKGLQSLTEHEKVKTGKADEAGVQYGGISKFINPTINYLNSIAYEGQALVMIINHASMNLDSMTSRYSPYVLTGGQKLKHLCSTIFFIDKPTAKKYKLLSNSKSINDTEYAVGYMIRAKVSKTRRTVEGKVAEFYWNLETGEFENRETELFKLAKNLGIIWKVEGKRAYAFGPEEVAISYRNEAEWEKVFSKDENLFNKVWEACSAVRNNPSTNDFNIDTIDVEAE